MSWWIKSCRRRPAALMCPSKSYFQTFHQKTTSSDNATYAIALGTNFIPNTLRVKLSVKLRAPKGIITSHQHPVTLTLFNGLPASYRNLYKEKLESICSRTVPQTLGKCHPIRRRVTRRPKIMDTLWLGGIRTPLFLIYIGSWRSFLKMKKYI